MGLQHDFKEARRKIARLDGQERDRLLTICQAIQQAQAALSHQATPILARCMTRCQGLCCRNIRVADIVTVWDLVYILTLAPELEPTLAACLAREDFFPADCLFLQNGVGPCLFPEHIRPERCVISFCRVEPTVEKEIGQVMRGFSRLIRFFSFRSYRRLMRYFIP
ncbi:hypothetical protein DESC_370208 [Desulfosarcina cetonica]|uniref:hypothetical protein n=1 Tax=Desulfosarcina cetonica TaxID=90730 RepID=UPI0006D1E749|nr:hypothetical protein [Desulfosarcina cetonica]VTR65839.1 hypothetical protein DESC_370208 [Desulfosarcina cetonica]